MFFGGSKNKRDDEEKDLNEDKNYYDDDSEDNKNDGGDDYHSKDEDTVNDDWDEEGSLAIDVYQTPDEIIIKSAVAGVRPEDIDVSIVGDMVTIKGSREFRGQVREDDYLIQECFWGGFGRSVVLPVDVDAENINAELKNGILTVRLPKIDKKTAKKIKVSMG